MIPKGCQSVESSINTRFKSLNYLNYLKRRVAFGQVGSRAISILVQRRPVFSDRWPVVLKGFTYPFTLLKYMRILANFVDSKTGRRNEMGMTVGA
jgi:hypothetical protein